MSARPSAGAPSTCSGARYFAVPTSVPDVPGHVLSPKGTWSDPSAYDEAAARLAGMFKDNFQKFAAGVPESVLAAGPR